MHFAKCSAGSLSGRLRATGAFTGSEGFDAYKALYAPGADVERLGEDFFASVHARTNGPLVMAERMIFNASTRRDAERVRRNAFDHLTLSVIHAGELELDAGGRSLKLRAGEVMFLDTTRPARYRARVEMTTVSLPRILAPLELSTSPRLHGLRLSERDGAPLVRWLAADSARPYAERTLATALAAALLPADRSSDLTPRRESRRRQDEARQLIEARLDDQALSPERLAKRLGVSRATLYRVFEPLGSIDRWRQNRRLLRLKARLAFSDLPIAEAAHQVGLENAAHASSLFSKSFGQTPSLFRRRAQERERARGAGDLAWIFESIAERTLQTQADALVR